MSKLTNYANTAVFVSVSLLLGACGGGGGGGGDSVTTSSSPVTISAANAPQLAAAAYESTAGLEGGGGGATSFLTGAVTQTSSTNIDLVDVLISQVKTAAQLASANASASLTGVVVSETMPCTSGSISITFDDIDNNQELSTGDSMSFTANDCTEDGMVMNGSVSINNVTVSGDPQTPLSPYSMQFGIQANNFTVTEGIESVALNGSMTMSESTSDGILFTHSITGSSIQVTEGGVSASLTNFNIQSTEDTLAYTLDLNATVSSPEIGGSVTIVTDTIFQGDSLADYPSSGQATITGANNSRVTLIAMGPNNVRLEIDEDGNGTAETFIDTTWDNL